MIKDVIVTSPNPQNEIIFATATNYTSLQLPKKIFKLPERSLLKLRLLGIWAIRDNGFIS